MLFCSGLYCKYEGHFGALLTSLCRIIFLFQFLPSRPVVKCRIIGSLNCGLSKSFAVRGLPLILCYFVHIFFLIYSFLLFEKKNTYEKTNICIHIILFMFLKASFYNNVKYTYMYVQMHFQIFFYKYFQTKMLIKHLY